MIMQNDTSMTSKRSIVCGATVSRRPARQAPAPLDVTTCLLTTPVSDDICTLPFHESRTAIFFTALLCDPTLCAAGTQPFHTLQAATFLLIRTLFAIHMQISWQWYNTSFTICGKNGTNFVIRKNACVRREVRGERSLYQAAGTCECQGICESQ